MADLKRLTESRLVEKNGYPKIISIITERFRTFGTWNWNFVPLDV
jgi:hypothetical protein